MFHTSKIAHLLTDLLATNACDAYNSKTKSLVQTNRDWLAMSRDDDWQHRQQ
jgi:hypothetical protein